ncbi:DNA polymerase alpha subunit B [Perkinsus chesapeaki]|uniref:DNA polymerase alpha subunit B n=1 Tax=Perkinsus chesapeaki TaxID=330153 RepID=A0A7J6N1J9_PERCH|nr:DNA polymerase alpha subunit B [Perkinsus chesapeaki]
MAAVRTAAQSRFDDPAFQGYRWMDNSVESRREGEASRCAKLYTEVVANANKLYRTLHPEEEDEGDLEIGVFGTQYSQPVLMVGRVCCEADENLQPVPEPLNLNPQSLLLEPIFTGGPGVSGRGRRLVLNVQSLDSYTVFPGCVVGVVGRTSPNSCGSEILAEAMVTGAGEQWVKKDAVNEQTISLEIAHTDGSPIHIVCASGPFQTIKGTAKGGERLDILSKYISDFKPAVLLLMGPFLDADVMEATLFDGVENPVSFEDTFNKAILPRIVKLALGCRETRTHRLVPWLSNSSSLRSDAMAVGFGLELLLIIIPSLNECCFNYPLPQPTLMAMRAYEPWATLAKHLEPMRHVRLGPNPCSIRLNDVTFYVTSADPFKSFTSEILSKAPGNENRPNKIELALEQFVSHRSLFPMSPSPLLIDANKLRAGSLRMPDATGIVVFPSIVHHFSKQIGGRLFLNCGVFTKGTGSGSMLSVFISPGGEKSESIESRVKTEFFSTSRLGIMISDIRSIVGEGWDKYNKMTPQKVKLLDLYIVFLAYLAAMQFSYMWLVGTFPYNSFLSGFWATMGTAALTCCYRIQLLSGRETFKEVGPERAYADYLVCAGYNQGSVEAMTYYRGDRSASSWARSDERMRGHPPYSQSSRRESNSAAGVRGLPDEGNPEVYEIKILVPDTEIRKIIGYRGETVDRLENHNRIKIISANNGNFFPGSQKQERAVRIVGRYRDVLRGLTQIVEMTEDPNDPQIYFVVPQRCVPAIIGTKGARVRGINDRYDTKIEVFTDQEYRCAFATDESVVKCALWKERMPANTRLSKQEKVSAAAMESIDAMAHSHYDSGPFSYNQRVNYEVSGQREPPYRLGRGEPMRSDPPLPRGSFGGHSASNQNPAAYASGRSQSSWGWSQDSYNDNWKRRRSGNAWDTWADDRHRSSSGQQRGGHREEQAPTRHGRIPQWETAEEDRSLREHTRFRSKKPVNETLAVAAAVVKGNEDMMPLQSTIVLPDIPAHAAALIIGGQGSMIRELKESSGANVVVRERGDGPRNVLISGHLSAVHGAMLAVCELIQLAEGKGSDPAAVSHRGGMRSLVAKMLALNQPSCSTAGREEGVGGKEGKTEAVEDAFGDGEEDRPEKRARMLEGVPEMNVEEGSTEQVPEALSQEQNDEVSEEIDTAEIGPPPSSPRGDYEQLALLKPLFEDLSKPPEERIRAATKSSEALDRQNEKEAESHRAEMAALKKSIGTAERDGDLSKKSLRARLSKAKQEKEDCIAEYEKLLQEANREFDKQRESLSKQIERATRQVESVGTKRATAERKSSELEVQNDSLRRKLNDAETQVKVLIKEIQALRSGGHNRSACSTQAELDGTNVDASMMFDSEVSAVMGAAPSKLPASRSVIVLDGVSELRSSNESSNIIGKKARSKTVIMEGERDPTLKRHRSGRPESKTAATPALIPEGQSPPRKRPHWNRKGATPVAERTRSRKAAVNADGSG